MSEGMLGLSYAQSQARSAKAVHRAIAWGAIGFHVMIGLGLVFCPQHLLRVGETSDIIAPGLARLVGVLLLVTSGYRLPGAYDSFRWRWPNVVAFIEHVLLALVFLFLFHGFPILALIEAGLAVALAVTYFNYLRAELMSRP